MFRANKIAIAVLFAAAIVCRAENITIPNYSFEQPPVPPETPAYPVHVAWQQTPRRADYVEQGQFTWNVLTGVFPNSTAADRIDNMDGGQAAYLFNERENGIFQILATKFTTGVGYTLTVGLVGSPNVPVTSGATLDIIIGYTNATGIVPLATTTVTYDSTTFPNGTHLKDFSVKISGFQNSSPANNQNIAILIKSTSTDETLGGVWDIDNARLTALREFVMVPNFSFENPTVPAQAPAYPVINNWQKFPQPEGWDEATMGPWTNLTGLFPNPAQGEAGHIDNLDRTQAAYIFATPGSGIYQDLTTKFELGNAYALTIGIIGSTSVPPTNNTPITIALYYRDAQNNMVPVAAKTIQFNETNFPNPTHFVDIVATSDTLGAGSAALNKNIGIYIASSAGPADAGGVWDADNVRITVAQGAALGISRVDNNTIKIEWASLPNTSYLLQRTTDFVTWENFNPVTGDGTTKSLQVSIDEPQMGFFRIIATPAP